MDLVQVCKILYVSFESVDLLSTQVVFFLRNITIEAMIIATVLKNFKCYKELTSVWKIMK